MKIDVVEMFTPEIGTVEINTLRDELTLVIPSDMEVHLVTHTEGVTLIELRRKA